MPVKYLCVEAEVCRVRFNSVSTCDKVGINRSKAAQERTLGGRICSPPTHLATLPLCLTGANPAETCDREPSLVEVVRLSTFCPVCSLVPGFESLFGDTPARNLPNQRGRSAHLLDPTDCDRLIVGCTGDTSSWMAQFPVGVEILTLVCRTYWML